MNVSFSDPKLSVIHSIYFIYYPAHTMLVCILLDIRSAVIISPGDRYLSNGAANRRDSLHDGRSVIWTGLFPFQWQQIQGQKGDWVSFWASKKLFDREYMYLENGKSQRNISIRASVSLTRAL